MVANVEIDDAAYVGELEQLGCQSDFEILNWVVEQLQVGLEAVTQFYLRGLQAQLAQLLQQAFRIKRHLVGCY